MIRRWLDSLRSYLRLDAPQFQHGPTRLELLKAFAAKNTAETMKPKGHRDGH